MTSIKTGRPDRGEIGDPSKLQVPSVVGPTRFTHPLAVETWDAAFRLRADSELRDVTIDDTWWRVAEAVTAHDGAQAPLWAHRYVDAFSQWRLLPDARLLRCAGAGQRPEQDAPPAAVLNVAAFVSAPFGIEPHFDQALFEDTAAMAVRLLDDALMTCDGMADDAGLRIGVVGFGDALRRLRIAYQSDDARAFAATVARALAEGCLRGAVDLAEERGAAHDETEGAAIATLVATRLRERGMPERLVERTLRSGVRHASLTAIQPQPLLARLANGASDGLDAVPASATGDPINAACEGARQAIAAAMQPWIDLPIGGPAYAAEAGVAASPRGVVLSAS